MGKNRRLICTAGQVSTGTVSEKPAISGTVFDKPAMAPSLTIQQCPGGRKYLRRPMPVGKRFSFDEPAHTLKGASLECYTDDWNL